MYDIATLEEEGYKINEDGSVLGKRGCIGSENIIHFYQELGGHNG